MRKHVMVPLMVCAVLLALMIPVMAQDATPAATPVPLTATTDLFVTTPFRVNVRSGPGIEYTRIGILTPLDGLDITGQTADTNWLRVNFNGQEGWVSVSVVDVNGAVEGAPVAEAGAGATLISTGTPTPDADTASQDVTITTRFNTNLRSTFSTDADILDMIPFDTELIPQGRTNDSNWLMVTYEDQSGWVYAPILFFASGHVETLPITGTVAELELPIEPTALPSE